MVAARAGPVAVTLLAGESVEVFAARPAWREGEADDGAGRPGR